jgi:23S rRNA (guanosine2251-2'-O)-methyltransferase
MLIYGLNPVLEALRAGLVISIQVAEQARSRTRDLVRLAEQRGVRLRWVDTALLDRLAGGGLHQGVVATIERPREYSLDDLLREAAHPSLVLVLDGIEDPQNLGAILRTADAAGVDGVIRQGRHSAPLSAAVAKASAGALAHIKIVTVVNIARALGELHAAGVWTVGFAAEAPLSYDQVDLTVPAALVIGAEGAGLRRLVRESCDWLVSIPMRGHLSSLNVSVAAGIALFEAVRQRSRAEPRQPGTAEGLQ